MLTAARIALLNLREEETKLATARASGDPLEIDRAERAVDVAGMEAAHACDVEGLPAILRRRPGLHADVPPAEYHARHAGLVSNGALRKLTRSPAHYKAWVDGAEEDEQTPALAFGQALHCALLEPDRFGTEYAVEPSFGDCRFKANRERRDTWRNANVGKLLLSPEDAQRVRGMISAVRQHPLAGRMLRDGVPELTLRWDDAETDLPCKARLDYYVPGLSMVVDFKSTLDARPESFRKSVASFGYHRQDAFYRAGLAAIGAPVEHFVFVAVEKEPPYAVAVFSLDANAVERGHAAVRRDMITLAECVRSNVWPAYPTTIQTLDLPPWAE